jgi:hypothetical protein
MKEGRMKTVLITTAGILLAMCTLLAQPAAKPAASAAGLGKTEAASNEETNIRAYIELLRTDVRKSRTGIMGEVMHLDAGQAAKFWPIYKDFETEYRALGDQVAALVKNYADHDDDFTEVVADQLAHQALSIKQQRNELKKKYYDRFKEGLGAITAARFLQVENQLERLIDLQVAASLPVISGK